MKYPMRCPECGHEAESPDVPMEQGPPEMFCPPCFMVPGTPTIVWMRRVFSAVPAVFRGGGWASKS